MSAAGFSRLEISAVGKAVALLQAAVTELQVRTHPGNVLSQARVSRVDSQGLAMVVV